jgi:membrane associated rhomboid family serine protease
VAGLQPCLEQQGREYAVTVDAKDADSAYREIEEYAVETPALATPPPNVSKGWPGAVVWVVILTAFHLLSRYQPVGLPWSTAGVAQAGLIQAGEWWRVVTALCLHADMAHLVGNMALGALLISLTAHRVGWGLTWLGVLLAGAFGNAINAMVQPTVHGSVGASTAVFGVLGILAVHGWKRNTEMRMRAIERGAPLVSGVLLLTMFGMAGERTDVVAHVAGFFSGMLTGWVLASLKQETLLNVRYQWIAVVGALAMLSLCWLLAFET